MTPSHAPILVSCEELAALEDLTDALCDLMTSLLYQSSLLPAEPTTPEFERIMTICGVVTKTEQTLKKLLLVYGRIEDSGARQIRCSRDTENEGSRSRAQGCA